MPIWKPQVLKNTQIAIPRILGLVLIALMVPFMGHSNDSIGMRSRSCKSVLSPLDPNITYISSPRSSIFLKPPTGLKNQSCTGSCVFHANVSRIEYLYYAKTKIRLRISEQQLYFLSAIFDLIKSIENDKKQHRWQGSSLGSFLILIRKFGLTPHSAWAHFFESSKANLSRIDARYALDLFTGQIVFTEGFKEESLETLYSTFVGANDEQFEFNNQTYTSQTFAQHVVETIGQEFIFNNYPVPLKLDDKNLQVYQWIIDELNSMRPVLANVNLKSSEAGSNHQLLIVGYELDKSGQVIRFITQNSWGDTWETNGYGSIEANKIPQIVYAVHLPVNPIEIVDLFEDDIKNIIRLESILSELSLSDAADKIYNGNSFSFFDHLTHEINLLRRKKR